jgi:hypothetical protein
MKLPTLNVEYRATESLIPYARNARTHSDGQITQIASSIKEFGFNNPILLDEDKSIIAGHGRYQAALKLGLKEVPCIELKHLSDAQKKAYILADNRIALNSDWDNELLKIELSELQADGVDLENLVGFDSIELNNLLEGTEETAAENKYERNTENAGILAKRFIIPPFSVLDTRSGAWQDRKRLWEGFIGDNGESRENALYPDGLADEIGTVSLFDATLAEIIIEWFTPKKTEIPNCIFDPFAGGMFGYVAAYKGNVFTGIELRQEQADLNNKRIQGLSGHYICDDGQNVGKYLPLNSQDLMFSCPPYFDLEKYSDLPNDASNQDYDGFISILRNAFLSGLKLLKDNRFAVIVMSNVRDKKGFYHDICSDITRIMEEGGAKLYNELILVNVNGMGKLRAANMMKNRKVCRQHQEVLVYFKGNPKKIQSEFSIIEIPEEEAGETESPDNT